MSCIDSPLLDPEALSAVLAEGGEFSCVLPHFEPRKEQMSMLKDICFAFNGEKIALIEAGTGTGKSFAYLIPSIMQAKQSGKRVAISTNTINLQEQLLHKDIPAVAKALGLNVRACLVKGMGNYLCLRRLHDTVFESRLLLDEHKEPLERIQRWAEKTEEGSRSDLSFSLPHAVWEKVSAESDTCSKEKCPYYKQCFFFNARKKAEDAELLILNHSLFFSDLALRSFYELSLLPSFSYVVLDEAHNIEDVATEHLSKKISIALVVKTLARLFSEKGAKTAGALPLLAKRMMTFAKSDESFLPFLQKIKGDLHLQREKVLTLAFEFFEELCHLLEEASPLDEQRELKLRLSQDFLRSALWKRAEELGKAFAEETISFSIAIASLCQELSSRELKELEGGISEVKALSERLRLFAENTYALIGNTISEEKVRWVQQEGGAILGGIQLVEANAEMKEVFPDALFKQFTSTVMVSATLTAGKGFSFAKERWGLTPYIPVEQVYEAVYPSPFDYAKQAAFIIPKNLPLPESEKYAESVQKALFEALKGSNGGAFFLFTSYAFLAECYEKLKDSLLQEGFNLFKQGEAPRSFLLSEFRKSFKGVLFGTDSFWEGVDVAGEALRLVVIPKLPFKVPSEPLQQARCQLLRLRGKEPFFSYSLPQAVLKFKQGFGRLIRHRKDRGVVLCLDRRIIERGYGKLFLNSIPACRRVEPSIETLRTTIREILQ